MAKKIALCLALASLLVMGGSAVAEICTIDSVPAATLLLPYFEVDLAGGGTGQTTLFSVNNASAAPAVAHVTMWTDLSVPTLDFDIYLTGYDVVTVNLYDVFVNGIVPITGPTVTPAGAFSFPNVDFPGCVGGLPTTPLPGNFQTHIQNAHTGQGSTFYGGACSGVNFGDTIARGYITIDSVNACSLSFPDTAGYFVDGGNGIANNNNILWGDYFSVDPAGAFAQGDNLVSIEASSTDARVTTPGNYTYYGRYVAATAADNREPLATTWATRYLNGGAFSGGTSLTCWRDTKLVQQPFACGTIPFPFPLSQEQVVVFDEDENPDIIIQPPFSPAIPGESITPCPWEASSGPVEDYVAFDFGWLYLNLNTSTGGVFDPYSQSYVSQAHDASGLYSVGYPGIQLDSACNPNDVVLPVNN